MTNEEAHALSVGDRVRIVLEDGQTETGTVIKRVFGGRRIEWDDGFLSSHHFSTYDFGRIHRIGEPTDAPHQVR